MRRAASVLWVRVFLTLAMASGLGCEEARQDVAVAAEAAATDVVPDGGNLTTGVRVGSVMVWLDSSATLHSVQALLSNGRMSSRPTADAGSEVCFAMGSPVTGWLVLSSNALGGPEETVLGYELRGADQPPAKSAECLSSSTPISEVSTDRGLHLGIDRTRVTSALGPPDSVAQTSVRYRRSLPVEIERTGAGGERRVVRYYAISELLLTLRNDLVVGINGWYVLTN